MHRQGLKTSKREKALFHTVIKKHEIMSKQIGNKKKCSKVSSSRKI